VHHEVAAFDVPVVLLPSWGCRDLLARQGSPEVTGSAVSLEAPRVAYERCHSLADEFALHLASEESVERDLDVNLDRRLCEEDREIGFSGRELASRSDELEAAVEGWVPERVWSLMPASFLAGGAPAPLPLRTDAAYTGAPIEPSGPIEPPRSSDQRSGAFATVAAKAFRQGRW
jgi:hypothetical protein